MQPIGKISALSRRLPLELSGQAEATRATGFLIPYFLLLKVSGAQKSCFAIFDPDVAEELIGRVILG